MNDFYRWLNPIIRELGLSDSEFARRAGLARTLVSHWRTHPDSQPTPDSVAKVVAYLQRVGHDVSLDYALLQAGIRDLPEEADPEFRKLREVAKKLTPSNQGALHEIARILRRTQGDNSE